MNRHSLTGFEQYASLYQCGACQYALIWGAKQVNGSYPTQVQQLSTYSKDYLLLSVILLLPFQNSAISYSANSLRSIKRYRHAQLPMKTFKCSTIRQTQTRISIHVHTLSIYCISMCNPIDEMNVGKLHIGVIVNIAQNLYKEWLSSRWSSFVCQTKLNHCCNVPFLNPYSHMQSIYKGSL